MENPYFQNLVGMAKKICSCHCPVKYIHCTKADRTKSKINAFINTQCTDYGALAQEYKDPTLFVVIENGSTPSPTSANTAILAFSAFALSSLLVFLSLCGR
jgi:hypothetical protein